jgi:hypothetical protein
MSIEIKEGRGDRTEYGANYDGRVSGHRFNPRAPLNVSINLYDADPAFVEKLMGYMRSNGCTWVDSTSAPPGEIRVPVPLDEKPAPMLVEFTEDEDG